MDVKNTENSILTVNERQINELITAPGFPLANIMIMMFKFVIYLWVIYKIKNVLQYLESSDG